MVVAEEKPGTDSSGITRASIRVLPGALLEKDVLAQWPDLAEGCVAEVRFMAKDGRRAATDIRYVVSTLHFDERRTARRLLALATGYRVMVGEGASSLSVHFPLDRNLCQNAAVLRGKARVARHCADLVARALEDANRETGRIVTERSIRAGFLDVLETGRLLSVVGEMGSVDSLPRT